MFVLPDVTDIPRIDHDGVCFCSFWGNGGTTMKSELNEITCKNFHKQKRLFRFHL